MKLRQQITEGLEVAVGRKPPVGDQKVIDSLKALDAIAADHGDQLDSELKHFLEKRSYLKALHWLEVNEGSAVAEN